MRSYQAQGRAMPRPSDFYRWTLGNVLWAIWGALKMTSLLSFASALLYVTAWSVGWHEALTLWGHVTAFLAVCVTIACVIIQITNGERW